ncbi:long-chain fatty acid--CoA ligase [Frankia sp. B2]|uniref:AMP-binding protein n=1 Tax=Frankia sp. B2 TaxID=2541730 RepID=UPI00106A7597|nr:AMP-binding protein [Frankia sp. B2]TFE31007.1 long-chain fatty acid--CoA ligase [Frankia sp. B2]
MTWPRSSTAPTNGLPSLSIYHLLEEAAAEAPDSTAVRDGDTAVTYRQLARFSGAFAEWLSLNGVESGDRVLVQTPSTWKSVVMMYGTARHGAIFVPINTQTRPFQLRSITASADPTVVITEGSNTGAAATEFLLGGGSTRLVRNRDSVWPEVEDIWSRNSTQIPSRTKLDDIAFLIYTSGSTASPKAVVCPHRNVLFACRAIASVLDYRPSDVIFCRFPLSWDYGLYKVLLACLARAEIVLGDPSSDFSMLTRMHETGTTVLPIVPSLASMIINLAARETDPLPPIRMFTNTGAMLPSATISALRRYFPAAGIVRQFGQTECKRISIMPPGMNDQRPDSVGLALPGTSVEIYDEQGIPLPCGEVGEIVVTGPHVMDGYWRNPELSARTFRRHRRGGELQLHTGDYGWLDDGGFLYFTGRRDDVFKRKGARVSVLEIEAAAMDIPGVRAAAVLPPNAERDLVLIVEAEMPPQMILREIATRLEPMKVPSLCRVIQRMPLTPNGKHSREALAALLSDAER